MTPKENLMDKQSYQLSYEDTIKNLNTHIENGLTEDEAKKRLEKYGRNELEESKKRPLILRFFDQINDFMIYVLIAASILSFVTDEPSEGILILMIVLLNALLGLFQEAKAEKALESIKAMSSPQAKVLRDGQEKLIDVKFLTAGDIVILDAGDYVPADVRIIESINLKTDESPLTGEAIPVEKTVEIINEDEVALGDRTNLGFMGTVVTYGRGKAVVIHTGMQTELGKIATMLSETMSETTPLQKSMAKLGKTLALLALGITFIIFAITIIEAYTIDGSASFEDWKEALLTSVALAVAAIPEGLPAIITIVLALGMQNLVKKNAIIRTLPAVETLGSTSIICSDKTGTLTQNLMTVTKVFVENKLVDINEKTKTNEALDKLTLFGALCNDTKVSIQDNQYVKIGDPTEIAFIDLALTLNKKPMDMIDDNERIYELPFDSDRKMMTTVHDFKDGRYAVVKGAPDVIFSRSSSVYNQEKFDIKPYEKANQDMSNNALRVLAVAFKKIDKSLTLKNLTTDDLETDLTLLGLVGMIDPARPEAKDAIELCNRAGIKTIMITGDHINTAVAIARDLNILSDHELAITGKELDQMSDDEFFEKLENIRVYARVSPENKVRIVDAWKRANKVVAMTGDGVNDAPSIKKADIGISMGITGTEVAKGAADMVLTDDNFATIVNAVSEGRTIFANIKKAIHFLLSCNIGEIVTIFLGTTIGILIFSGRVTTLTAVQILWVNLVTDSLMAIALGLEPKEENIMDQQPRDTQKSIFADGLGMKIGLQGLMLGLISFAAYIIGWFLEPSAIREVKMITAQTMTFIVLALSQLAHAFNVRSELYSIFKLKRNKFIFYALAASITLQLLVVFIPFTRDVFGITALPFNYWFIIIGLVILPILIIESIKLVKNRK
jgi:Ca2+-transporting ATPase